MSYDENDPIEYPRYFPFIAGSFSEIVSRFICQPLDVIKIRFQLQVEPITKHSAESKYKGMLQAGRLIIQEEGVTALWKGHIPAQLLSATYGMVQFGVYDALVREFNKNKKTTEDKKVKIEFVCGYMAGCLATVVSCPFDIVRTRLILQGNKKEYRNALHALVEIVKHEGFRGWFKGLTPGLIQIGPLAGLQFATFNFYLRRFKEFETRHDINSKWYSVTEVFVAGSLAGLTAKALTYPLDLFKKRMQFQGFQKARRGYGKNFACSNLRTCFIQTIKKEKFRGLYKGLVPSLIKSSFANALVFTVYEETLLFLAVLHKANQ